MRQVADGVMTWLASLLTHVFFRHVEVEGTDNLPRHGPLVVIANHSNGLVDGLLLMTALRRYPRFLGKSTLFQILPLRPFLKLAGVVPVYRKSDSDTEHQGAERNEATFRTSRQLLARGGVVAVFPEGISHNEPALQPLHTGAARIALSAAADEGTEGLATVAVGLVYDAKATFRSRALVRVGVPRSVAPWVAAYREDPRAAARGLTDEMAEQLHEVVATYRSWQDAEMLAAIADLVVTPVPGGAGGAFEAAVEPGSSSGPSSGSPSSSSLGPASSSSSGSPSSSSLGPAPSSSSGSPSSSSLGPALADRERVAVALSSVDLDLDGTAGRKLKDAYQVYRRDLDLMGVTDAQVTARYGRHYQAALAWSIAKVTLALPPGLVGVAVHALPYQVMKRVGQLPRNESVKSTVKLLGCFALFNIEYLAIAEVVRRKWGYVAGAIAFLVAPLSGYATLRLSERVKSVGGLIEGANVVRSRPLVLPTVLGHRADVVQRACELVGCAPEVPASA